jgi:hypothetical protein
MSLYRQIRDNCETTWNASWTHPDVPVFWRSDDAQPLPDPQSTQHFFRNEIDFGGEETDAIGGGRGNNLKVQRGSVVLRCFTSRTIGTEDLALDLLSDGVAIFRSYRGTDTAGGDLSFIGRGSGFDWGPGEDGNWFMRSVIVVFEYRFLG